jgi:hypothetical protein
VYITSSELDIEQYELDKTRPADILPRGDREVWLVREKPIETDISPRFLWASEGTHVQIPLYPYLARGLEPARAMAMAAKLGALLMAEAYPWLPRDRPYVFERLHITLGHPVQEMSSTLRFWIGFALLVKEGQNQWMLPKINPNPR